MGRNARVFASLAVVLLATTTVALGVVANDRGDEVAAERAREATLTVDLEEARTREARVGARLERMLLRIGVLRARLDRSLVEERRLERLLARLRRLADERAEELATLHGLLGSMALCSAAGFTPPSLPAGLPTAVRRRADAIIEEATTCDLPGLARLAVRDREYPFEYGLDAEDPPAIYWTKKEYTGFDTTASLVELFGLPMGTERWEGTGLGLMYVWPSAAAYDSWAQVPENEKAPVRAWYAQDGGTVPVYAGNYWGWRVVIGHDGAWRVFVSSPD